MKFLNIFGLLLILLLGCFLFFYDSGGMTKRTQTMLRISRLQVWYNGTLDYVHENGELPTRLYDINFPHLKIIGPHIKDVKERRDNYYKATKDPNFFEEYVDYQLLISSDKTWIIIEKEIPKLDKRYLIDNDGKISSREK